MKTEDPNNGITLEMWLHMLEQGGRWTVAELAEKFKLPRPEADRYTYFMVRSGCATRFRRTDRKNGVAFGVTNENDIPRGLKLQDLLRATGIRLWE